MEEAERIARDEHRSTKIAVISGVLDCEGPKKICLCLSNLSAQSFPSSSLSITWRDHRPHLTFFSLSGVGTRDYYRKLGYELEGPYMVKFLEADGA